MCMYLLALSYYYPLSRTISRCYLIFCFFNAACNFQDTNNHTKEQGILIYIYRLIKGLGVILNPKEKLFYSAMENKNVISFGVLFIYINAKPPAGGLEVRTQNKAIKN